MKLIKLGLKLKSLVLISILPAFSVHADVELPKVKNETGTLCSAQGPKGLSFLKTDFIFYAPADPSTTVYSNPEIRVKNPDGIKFGSCGLNSGTKICSTSFGDAYVSKGDFVFTPVQRISSNDFVLRVSKYLGSKKYSDSFEMRKIDITKNNKFKFVEYLSCKNFDYTPPVTDNKVAKTDRISARKGIFKAITQDLGIGEAYRVPSGLIWGDMISRNGRPVLMTVSEGEKYCGDLGARLPTRQEIVNLAKHLGDTGVPTGIFAEMFAVNIPADTMNRKTLLLPNSYGIPFWTSTRDPLDSSQCYLLGGDGGGWTAGNFSCESKRAVRCVMSQQ